MYVIIKHNVDPARPHESETNNRIVVKIKTRLNINFNKVYCLYVD